MSEYEYCILDTNNEDELIEYEKELFDSFSKLDPDGWVMNNYQIINGNRLRSKTLTYEDIEVYLVKNYCKILIGSSVNYNVNKKLQLEIMGFYLDKKIKNFCEGLIFFTTEQAKNHDFLKISTNLFEFIKKKLLKKNIKTVYGTCSRKLKAMYSLLGYEVIDKLVVNNEKKLLMKLEM